MIAGSTPAEVAYVIGHSGADVLITDAAGWEAVRGASEAIRLGAFVEGVASPEGARPFAALEHDDVSPPPDPGVGLAAPMAIMYTSGSTGRPKGVVQPTASLAVTGRALVDAMGLVPQDNILCALPLFHTAATQMAFGSAVAAGACLTLAETFSRDGFWPLVREARATASYLFPAQIAILLSAPASPHDRDHELRICFSHVRNQPFCDRFGVDVRPGWAMTETCGMGTLTRSVSGDPSLPRVGVPYPPDAQVRVVDEDRKPVAAGVLGEIQFTHPQVMSCYHRDPEQTALALNDGWVSSGDLGSLDPDGILSYRGRIKNLIKRSGENISGEEVELTLMSHPAVEEAVVFAVPDPIRTEEAYAAVSLRGGHPVAPEALHEWCSLRLSTWKLPRYIALTREPFPRLANGKTDRGRIRADADPAAAWQPPSRRKGTRT
jgi:crotonobetaine/carnitine-CoA ligase